MLVEVMYTDGRRTIVSHLNITDTLASHRIKAIERHHWQEALLLPPELEETGQEVGEGESKGEGESEGESEREGVIWG
jgi:hypothetical protein